MIYLPFIIHTVAFTYLLTQSAILQSVRKTFVGLAGFLPEHFQASAIQLIYCPTCSGFWFGLFWSVLYPGMQHAINTHNVYAATYLRLEAALAGMLVCTLWARFVVSHSVFSEDWPQEGENHGSQKEER